MAISDIAGLASSATSASLSFSQSAQKAGQQELQIQAQSTGGANTAQTGQVAVTGASESGTSGDQKSSSGSPFRGTQVDISV